MGGLVIQQPMSNAKSACQIHGLEAFKGGGGKAKIMVWGQVDLKTNSGRLSITDDFDDVEN